jgi:RimJ/RimL family protein N-acetyltransferase
MLSDGVIVVDDTKHDEIPAIMRMESDEDAADFVTQFSAERHGRDFRDPDIVYKSIYDENHSLIGFIILVLDPDVSSVELRRIVVTPKGRGYGQRAIALADCVCRDEIGRHRIWLDVFELNVRARRVYEHSGYRQFGTAEQGGKPLLLYEKTV